MYPESNRASVKQQVQRHIDEITPDVRKKRDWFWLVYVVGAVALAVGVWQLWERGL